MSNEKTNTIMSEWHGGKGSKRRSEDARAIIERWPDFSERYKWRVNDMVIEMTYGQMLTFKRENPGVEVTEVL